MSVARVAIWDEPPELREDDARRAQSLYDLLQSCPGFVAACYLREESTGRLMNVTVWDSEEALVGAERAVSERPVSDQRGIRASRVERWSVEAAF